MVYTFLDLEYCYPGMTRGTPRPTEKDMRQIVQIAAIQYELSSGRELDHLNVLTKPTFERVLPEFFVELTNITQDQVDLEGIDFVSGLEQLVVFCDGTAIVVYDQDWFVIDQNCGYIGARNPFSEQFLRVKPMLSHWGIRADEYSSGTLYKAANLEMNGHVHNALHDVRSMAAALSVLSKQNDKPLRDVSIFQVAK